MCTPPWVPWRARCWRVPAWCTTETPLGTSRCSRSSTSLSRGMHPLLLTPCRKQRISPNRACLAAVQYIGLLPLQLSSGRCLHFFSLPDRQGRSGWAVHALHFCAGSQSGATRASRRCSQSHLKPLQTPWPRRTHLAAPPQASCTEAPHSLGPVRLQRSQLKTSKLRMYSSIGVWSFTVVLAAVFMGGFFSIVIFQMPEDNACLSYQWGGIYHLHVSCSPPSVLLAL